LYQRSKATRLTLSINLTVEMPSHKPISLPSDPVRSATVAGLRYVQDHGPGIQRQQAKEGFRYIGVNGKPIRDKEELRRIQALVIPPAWTDVWICPSAQGHLQAVGRDARGRKQYRYHPGYREVRDQTKFSRMLAFGAALRKIRRHVRKDLGRPGLPREKVLAVVVKLLETTCMRVGNDEYVRQNSSYGLTTLHDKHVIVKGSRVQFTFRGKSGQEQDIELNDATLAKIVKKCRDLPGYELFQYVSEDGNRCRIDSEDVNSYLREITGEEFTAKDFRTWGGTGLAALALGDLGACETEAAAKRNVMAAIKAVAGKLGNRPATCRKYYIHPAVIDAYMEGSLLDLLRKYKQRKGAELCVLTLVKAYAKDLACQQKMGRKAGTI
jgi:DNA topoisomerase-1